MYNSLDLLAFSVLAVLLLEIISFFLANRKKPSYSRHLRREIAALHKMSSNSRQLAKNRGAWWM